MKYISTRGKTESRSFIQAVSEGLARDGGLLVPEAIPDFSNRLDYLATLKYQELAYEIFLPFVGNELTTETLKRLIGSSYASFTASEITPVTFVDDIAILELFHGPTLAFKDIALQFLGNLFAEILKDTCDHLNILGATSGDTGSAAIHGVRGKERINIFMLHPKQKISPIQEKQMTTVLDQNVHNIALEGTFDDAQQLVKEIFNDLAFRDRFQLGAVNSINWARVMAQIVYYFYAAFQFIKKCNVEEVVFSVPTGNFGDIYAGYMAKKMGLPIKQLILATNENDILYRAIDSGHYKISHVQATMSPSMDIQIASNFERFIFDISGRDPQAVTVKMNCLAETGQFILSAKELSVAKAYFKPMRIDTAKTLSTMKKYYKKGITLDPHTAVGMAAAEESGLHNVIALATAHPSKFGKVVELATGSPAELPPALQGIMDKPTRCLTAPNDRKSIQNIIESTLLKQYS